MVSRQSYYLSREFLWSRGARAYRRNLQKHRRRIDRLDLTATGRTWPGDACQMSRHRQLDRTNWTLKGDDRIFHFDSGQRVQKSHFAVNLSEKLTIPQLQSSRSKGK